MPPDFTRQGKIEDYVGINVTYNKDSLMSLTQPQLTKSILDDLQKMNASKPSLTPAMSPNHSYIRTFMASFLITTLTRGPWLGI
jgi:hypothetical protein